MKENPDKVELTQLSEQLESAFSSNSLAFETQTYIKIYVIRNFVTYPWPFL